MKKIWYWLVPISLVVVIVVIKMAKSGEEKAAAPSGPPPAMGVDIVVLQPVDEKDEISLPGTVIASEDIIINPEVSGKVTSISFQEGERVSKGQLLLTIDQPELRADLEKINEEIKLAGSEAGRREKLLDLGGISREEYEQSYTRLKSLEADRQRIIAELAKGQIRAPFSGVTGLRQVSEGSFISPQDPVTTLKQINQVKIEFKVPERYVSSVSDGKSVSLITGEGVNANAQIFATEGGIDPVSRTLTVRAIANGGSDFMPGSFVEVHLPVSASTTGFSIPTEALMPEIDGNKVFLMKNGKAVKQKVQTGKRGPYLIELTRGVSQGDTVIISGLLVLREGAAVAAKKK